jgi:hypothetical protein
MTWDKDALVEEVMQSLLLGRQAFNLGINFA